MAKFRNNYRIESVQLNGWDYRRDAAYFITICTAHQQHFFGKIQDEKMYRNAVGELAYKYRYAIPAHFPFIKIGGIYCHAQSYA